MDKPDAFDWPPLCQFVEQQAKLMFSHSLEGFVFEGGNRRTFLDFPDESEEVDNRSRRRRSAPAGKQARLINRIGRDRNLAPHFNIILPALAGTRKPHPRRTERNFDPGTRDPPPLTPIFASAPAWGTCGQ